MSKISLKGNESGAGTTTLISPNSDSDFQIFLPPKNGTVSVLSKDPETYVIEGVTITSKGEVSNYTSTSSSASTVAKVCNLANFSLKIGSKVFVKFINGNTATNMTLNVNGTGAKYVKIQGGNVSNTLIHANELVELVYDGTAYNIVGGFALRDDKGNIISSTYLTSGGAGGSFATKGDLEALESTLSGQISSLSGRVGSVESSTSSLSGEITAIKRDYMTKSAYQTEIDNAFSAVG